MAIIYSGYDGITVTVPNDGNPHQLLALLQAVDPNVSAKCRYMTIQNSPRAATSDTVLMGGAPTDSQGNNNPSKLTSSNCAVEIIKGASETFEGFRDEDFNIARWYVMTNGASAATLNVQIVRG